MANIGFIGLGRMGRPMALNLVKAGHRVTVFNRSKAPADALAAAGAARVTTMEEAARDNRFVFINLSTPDVVRKAVTRALQSAAPGTIFIDHSTIGVAHAREFDELCRSRGCRFLDAPVSGGPWGAEAASLAIMVGGDPETFAEAQPLLNTLGKNIHYCGPSGAGSAAKLVNNLLVAIHSAALNEAMVLGVKAGLDPAQLYEILQGATGFSKMVDRSLPNFIFKGNFEPAFSISHLHKDVVLATDLARELSVRLLVGATTQQLLEEARASGLAEKDMSATILPLEKLSGVEVRTKA